ncbi:MAG: class II aldolase/adducin family protein [Armatimonadota bacterium]
MAGHNEQSGVDALTERLVTACRILTRQRLVAAFGHVSARIAGTDHFLISPRVGPGTATPETLLVVDLAGRVQRGSSRPPLELPIHTAIYRARSDVEAICRIHGEAASVLSVLRVPVRPLHYLGSIVGGEIPVHDDGALVTDDARAQAMVGTLGRAQALLLRGNGQVVVGGSLAEACVRAVYLEEAARLQMAAMPLGTPRYYSSEEVAVYARAWEDPINIERVWAFYARALPRSQ